MEKKKKSIIIGIISLFLITLLLLGLTYAYYRTRIMGNPDKESVFVQTKKLEIVYQNESAAIVTNEIEPGYNAIKTFEVKNNGDEKVNYSIMLDNVENTFSRINDWTFILKEGETILKSGIVPQTESYIEYSEEIAAGETKSYTLEINYANAAEDQSVDMGSSLSLRININEEVGETFNKAEPNTLLAAIGRDNIISEPLTIPGKEASKGTLYEEGNLDEEIHGSNVSSAYQNYYWVYATGYEFDPTTGKYTLTGVKIGVYSDIYNELNEKYLISPNGYYNSALTEEEAANLNTSNLSTLYKVVSAKSNGITYKIKEAAIAIQGEALFAVTEDDYGDSYYFRGMVENNYVNFSGMCWRIVRIDGNGNIKLTLSDGANECNSDYYSLENEYSAFIGGSEIETFSSDLSYEESLAKVALEVWLDGGSYVYIDSDFNELKKEILTGNIDENEQEKLFQAEWCSDESILEKYFWGEDADGNVVDNENFIYFGGISYYFGPYVRYKNSKPTLKCDSKGLYNSNAKQVKSNIGMLNADEIMFAGTGDNYYLRNNATSWYSYWTMSPSIQYIDIMDGNFLDGPAEIFGIYGQSLGSEAGENSYHIRPTVVLKSTVLATTDANSEYLPGTYQNPYKV